MVFQIWANDSFPNEFLLQYVYFLLVHKSFWFNNYIIPLVTILIMHSLYFSFTLAYCILTYSGLQLLCCKNAINFPFISYVEIYFISRKAFFPLK